MLKVFISSKAASEEMKKLIYEACIALGKIGDPATVPFLADLLETGGKKGIFGKRDVHLMMMAAHALGEMDLPEVKEHLQKAVKSNFESVAQAAEVSLAKLEKNRSAQAPIRH